MLLPVYPYQNGWIFCLAFQCVMFWFFSLNYWKTYPEKPFCIIFMQKKPCLKVQILQHKFFRGVILYIIHYFTLMYPKCTLFTLFCKFVHYTLFLSNIDIILLIVHYFSKFLSKTQCLCQRGQWQHHCVVMGNFLETW